jgi:hypothetical protein
LLRDPPRSNHPLEFINRDWRAALFIDKRKFDRSHFPKRAQRDDQRHLRHTFKTFYLSQTAALKAGAVCNRDNRTE